MSDQPRDERGRWAGSGSSVRKVGSGKTRSGSVRKLSSGGKKERLLQRLLKTGPQRPSKSIAGPKGAPRGDWWNE